MRQLTSQFLDAAQQLGDALLADLAQRDPALAAKVSQVVTEGSEELIVAFVVGHSPAVELLTRKGKHTVRGVVRIALDSGEHAARH